MRVLLLLYGFVNAALYSSLLPLWEGFDEVFHYGYVQYLGAHHRFPVLGPTALSLEINRSLGLVPMSFIMIRNTRVKGVRSFDQYFALDSSVRHSLYDQAQSIPRDLRLSESAEYTTNYEVHHAPLAYMLMAIPDSVLWRLPLPRRVWMVRLFASFACVWLMFSGMWALGSEAGLDARFSAVLVFLMFSCQMFWATVAHVDNDWLAVPLAVWMAVWALRFDQQPSLRAALWLATVFGLGLLSKAYFLVFVPLYLLAALAWYRKRTLRSLDLLAMLAIPLILAGPWYARNLVLYGNITARVEESNGVTAAGVLKSLAAIPWLKSIPFMARATFWLGNGSFTDFSVSTMNTVLLLLAASLILYMRRPAMKREVFLWAPIIFFFAGMVYVTGSSYSFTKGEVAVASTWYLQAVMAPLLCLALLGCQRSGRAGSWLAAAMALLWGYTLAATYVAKLFPLYGGFSAGRSTLHDIAHWYSTDWPRTADILSTIAMVPPAVLLILLAACLTVLCISAAKVVKSLI
jgi:hypothetical protein